ncbi:mannitol dehydrogenase family protein [Microbacterium sp. SD291]|uniref:mannitol dehydrogenase family protein n=1 Tax=Microbacterium sp. SD291 TaxID=2782007 RepID=UPI001A979C53|nr:mannitol dehydrogenase family protein [Microbacterium sp. SD291]MBO0979724.1 mannitol dehydrogenase family protein [Microbacterium sp. SD291]
MHDRHPRPEAPTIVHLGVGAFHRAHQAWYTHLASGAGERWSITAFTGRSAAQARLLEARGGRYTLLTRGPERDAFTQIDSIRSVHDGAERRVWEAALADLATHVITLTVTEAGYGLGGRGGRGGGAAAVDADVRRAMGDPEAPIMTAPVRLALGLSARRNAAAGPITVISCDNLSSNGAVTRSVVLSAARTIDPALADWIDANVAFLSSMVDRITPRTTDADIDEVQRATGIRDEGAVVTEPFSEWVIEDGFAGPRPAWEHVGVRLTHDLEPYENRKLRILNGAHSLLAYRGLLRGFGDVATAFGDPALRALVEEYWEVAAASCDLPAAELAEAIAATRSRFANPRIRHLLAQIATDGAHKLPQRVVPVLAHATLAGRAAAAAASAIAAWAVCGGHSGAEIDVLLADAGDADAVRAMRASIDRELRRLEGDPSGAASRAEAVRS